MIRADKAAIGDEVVVRIYTGNTGLSELPGWHITKSKWSNVAEGITKNFQSRSPK